ncbi:MAG: hypothetical protein ACT4UQ_09060, partial [Gammaproteobacteria bacterium]
PRQGGSARQRHLFYVPNLPGTAGAAIYEVLCTAADVTAMVPGCASVASVNAARSTQFQNDTEAYIQRHGLEAYRGQILPRNSHRSPWLSVLDLRFAQELPVWGRVRGTLTLDIENFANMINSDWGQLRQVSFFYAVPVLDVNRITTSGCPGGSASCYVFRRRGSATGPVEPTPTFSALPSVWKIQLGVRFEF